MTRYLLIALLVSGLVQPTGLAWAEEVGTIAAAEGSAEIGRDNIWVEANVGSAVQLGDQLRTGRPGRLRVVFRDDTVLTVTDASLVTVDELVFDPDRGSAESLIGLLRGKISVLVSEYYSRPGAAYEVRTPTAVGGVRGTEFVVAYNPETEVTEVVGISGRVWVHSLVDPTGPGVLVTAHEATSVARGELPTRPTRLEEQLFRQQLEGIDFIGAAHFDSLTTSHPLRAGAGIPAPDRAGAASASRPAGTNQSVGDQGAPKGQGSPSVLNDRDPGSLVGQSPPVVETTTGQLGIEF